MKYILRYFRTFRLFVIFLLYSIGVFSFFLPTYLRIRDATIVPFTEPVARAIKGKSTYYDDLRRAFTRLKKGIFEYSSDSENPVLTLVC